MGWEAHSEMNQKAEIFADFFASYDFMIGGSVHNHKSIHKTTWVSPDRHIENQTDFISMLFKDVETQSDVKKIERRNRCGSR